MSRYGTVIGGAANARSITVQASEADVLFNLISTAAQQLIESGIFPNPVLTSAELTGSGDGFMFYLHVEFADQSNVNGGAIPAAPGFFFLAATADVLQMALAQSPTQDQPVLDVQIAGAAKGQRVMGIVIFGFMRPESDPAPYLVWAPGLTNPKPPIYSDWNTIESIVNSFQGAVTLGVDQTGIPVGFLPVPATANLDGQGRLKIIGIGPRGEAQLDMADGAQIKNVREWRTVVVRAKPTVRSPIVYDLNGLITEEFDATFLFSGAATKPIIQMAPNIYIAMLMYMSSQFRNGANPGQAVLDIGASSTLLLGVGVNVFGGVTFVDTISGPVGSVLNMEMDSTLLPPTFAQFFGTLSIAQDALAGGTKYTPTVLANWSGVDPMNVQNALDRIAAAVGPIP